VPAYRLLSTEQMSSISRGFLVDHRPVLEGIPQAKGILANIDSAHKGLAIVVGGPPSKSQQVRELYKQCTTKDNRHDNFLRLGYSQCTLLAAFAAANENYDEEAAWFTTRKTLYRNGLRGSILSFEDQEGAAILVENSLDKDLVAKLSGVVIYLGGKAETLLSIVQEQINLAKEIAALDRTRKKLEETEDHSPTAGDLRKARNTWIEATHVLESALRLAVKLQSTTQETVDAILKKLHEAEKEASKQYAAERLKELEAEKAKQASTTPEPLKEKN
jgi:hypothetical protein